MHIQVMTDKIVFFTIFGHATPLNFDVLNSNSNQLILAPRCSYGKSLVKFQKFVIELWWNHDSDGATGACMHTHTHTDSPKT